MKATPKIGIVSGIGPLAGADVLTKLFKNAAVQYGAIEDYQYPDVILLSHGIKGVDNTGSLNSQFEEAIVQMVKQLEDQGCNIIGIACNTAHIYLSKIKVNKGTTLVNLIEVTTQAAAKTKHGCLLLTSSTSREHRLYHQYLDEYQVRYRQTNKQQQLLVDQAIGLVMAHKLTQAGQLLKQILTSAKKSGIENIVAGCTELPIAIEYSRNQSDLNIIDGNDLLARSLLNQYYDQTDS